MKTAWRMIASVDKGEKMQTQIPRLYKYRPHKQVANTMLEWVKDSLDGYEIELKNTLRWEDDGGRLVAVEELEATLTDLRRLI